jgi:hypothetical protein
VNPATNVVFPGTVFGSTDADRENRELMVYCEPEGFDIHSKRYAAIPLLSELTNVLFYGKKYIL